MEKSSNLLQCFWNIYPIKPIMMCCDVADWWTHVVLSRAAPPLLLPENQSETNSCWMICDLWWFEQSFLWPSRPFLFSYSQVKQQMFGAEFLSEARVCFSLVWLPGWVFLPGLGNEWQWAEPAHAEDQPKDSQKRGDWDLYIKHLCYASLLGFDTFVPHIYNLCKHIILLSGLFLDVFDC